MSKFICAKCGKSGKKRSDFSLATIIIGDDILICEDCMWDARMLFIKQLENKDPVALAVPRKTYDIMAGVARKMGHTPITFKQFMAKQAVEIEVIKAEYTRRRAKMN